MHVVDAIDNVCVEMDLWDGCLLTKAFDGGGKEHGGRQTFAVSVHRARVDLTTEACRVRYMWAILGKDGAGADGPGVVKDAP